MTTALLKADPPRLRYPTTEAWRLRPHEDHASRDARPQPADADRRGHADAGRPGPDQHRHAARPRRHRRRHHRLGRGLRPPHLPGHARGASTRCSGPCASGRDPGQISAPPRRPPARRCTVFGRNGPDDLRAVGHRHRAVGHRGQGGRPAALPPARRRRRDAICRPMRACCATGGPTRSSPLHGASARPRLSPHQAARDHRARGEGGARRDAGPACRSWSTPTVRGRVREAIEMARRLRRSTCTGWRSRCGRPRITTGLAEVRRRGGIADRGRRELRHGVREFRRAFEAGAIDSRSRA